MLNNSTANVGFTVNVPTGLLRLVWTFFAAGIIISFHNVSSVGLWIPYDQAKSAGPKNTPSYHMYCNILYYIIYKFVSIIQIMYDIISPEG